MFKFLKIAYLKPTETYRGRNITKKMTVGMVLLLNLITSIGFLFLMSPQFIELNKDAQEISENIPEFSIDSEDHTLKTDSDGFGYQTQNILVFFDPEDQLKEKEAKNNHEVLSPKITMAFYSKELEFYIGNSFNYKQKYSKLPGFSASAFRELLNTMGQLNLTFILITFGITYLLNLMFTLLYTLIAGLMGQSIALFMGIRMKFKQAYRVTLLASFIPITVIAIATAIGGIIPYSYELYLLFTALLVYNSLKVMKNRMFGK